MENLDSIKDEIDLTLENFIFDEDKDESFIIQLESYLDENLNPMLYYNNDLVDYWINIKENDYEYDINIGIQIGEYEDSKVYNLETIFKY